MPLQLPGRGGSLFRCPQTPVDESPVPPPSSPLPVTPWSRRGPVHDGVGGVWEAGVPRHPLEHREPRREVVQACQAVVCVGW